MSLLAPLPYSAKLAGNIFAHGVPTLEGRHRQPDLLDFLRRDTGRTIFFREYTVLGGILSIKIRLSDGTKVKPICGLTGIDRLYMAVREELVRGKSSKVLYGWVDKADGGILKRARIRYVLAIKEGASWKILEESQPLAGLNNKQEMTRASKLMAVAVTQGLGERVIGRWWTVNNKPHDQISYSLNGEEIPIYGFGAYRRVFSLTFETAGQIIARFYPEEVSKKDLSTAVPIKVVCLAKKTGAVWGPLRRPEVIEAVSPVQASRVRGGRTIEFLKADLPVGSFWDLEPRKVSQTRSVAFGMGRAYLRVFGFVEEDIGQEVFGRIIVESDQKVAYFWRNQPDRAVGNIADSVTLVSRTMAVKKNGKWQIVWMVMPEADRLRTASSLKYGNYLYSSRTDREPVFETWSVWHSVEGSYQRARLGKRIRKEHFSLDVSRLVGQECTELFSVTRTIQGVLKIVQFWPTRFEYEHRRPPLLARFIAFKPRDGKWGSFWQALDDTESFKLLIKTGQTTPEIMSRVFSSDFFIENYPEAIRAMDDDFLLFKYDPDKIDIR